MTDLYPALDTSRIGTQRPVTVKEQRSDAYV